MPGTNSGYYSFIGGGGRNTVTGQHSGILGGFSNRVEGNCSVVLGGENNHVTHNYAAAFGNSINSVCDNNLHVNQLMVLNMPFYLGPVPGPFLTGTLYYDPVTYQVYFNP